MIKNPSIKSKPMEKPRDHGSKLDPHLPSFTKPSSKTNFPLDKTSQTEKQKDLHAQSSEGFKEPNLEELSHNFQNDLGKLCESSPLKATKVSKNGSGNFIERFKNDGNFRSAAISGLNAFLHSLTVATGFTPGLKQLNEILDKSAFFFTKIVSPFVSYGMSAWSAFTDKKPIETLIKMIPPTFLPIIGDANVDTVFGTCTGFNQPYDVLLDRIKEKSAQSPEYAQKVKEKNQTSLGNAQLILEETKNMLKDFFAGKLDFWKESGYLINCAMILTGSLPMLLFARQERNTVWAQGFGILRNLGGIMGDVLFVSQKASFHKLLVGILCSLGALSNIAKRLTPNETLARVFIHLGAALDVAGYTVWNAFSDKSKEVKEASVAVAA